MWGARVIIPPQGSKLLLGEFHETHPGVSKMKALARNYLWWPGMDGEIKNVVKTCARCQTNRPSPSAAQLHPWEWPSKPWSRLHIDFAGPFRGHKCLTLVDSHSKWLGCTSNAIHRNGQDYREVKIDIRHAQTPKDNRF